MNDGEIVPKCKSAEEQKFESEEAGKYLRIMGYGLRIKD